MSSRSPTVSGDQSRSTRSWYSSSGAAVRGKRRNTLSSAASPAIDGNTVTTSLLGFLARRRESPVGDQAALQDRQQAKHRKSRGDRGEMPGPEAHGDERGYRLGAFGEARGVEEALAAVSGGLDAALGGERRESEEAGASQREARDQEHRGGGVGRG